MKAKHLSILEQILFLALVLGTQIGVVALCMIAASRLVAHLYAPKFWGGLFVMLSTVCFIGFTGAVGLYLQSKYKIYQKRSRGESAGKE